MTTAGSPQRLSDVGERELIRTVLAKRYARARPDFGDDCALVIATNLGSVVASTDPAPRPVAWELGLPDFYTWGWLLAAINLSDLAATGAQPLGLLTSLTLQNSMTVGDLERLLEGIDDCCTEAKTAVIGGNIKEASAEETDRCEATAIGLVTGAPPMSRSGASPGDALVALGPTGAFWSAVMLYRHGQRERAFNGEGVSRSLLTPKAQLAIGQALREGLTVTASTDASDGLYAAVHALTLQRGLGAFIDSDAWLYPSDVVSVADELGIDPRRLALGFGDFQLVCTARTERLGQVRDIAQALGVHFMPLGSVTAGASILLQAEGTVGQMSNFDNERFTENSQFTAGLDAYQRRLMTGPLHEPTNGE